MKEPRIVVGRQILDIVTSGMYNDPLMVYREYVQNAADAIDTAVSEGLLKQNTGQIDVRVDGKQRCVMITDNGTGMTHKDALNTLCSIGVSSKDQANSRGFRGIGRLGALAYCRTLKFETRASGARRITVIQWDAERLREALSSGECASSLQETIGACVKVNMRPVVDEPEHFFRVTMVGITSFYRDELMTLESIRRYLSQVAPVAHDPCVFSFGEHVRGHVSEIPGYRTYVVNLNGEQVYRPHRDDVDVSGSRQDMITDVQLFDLRGAEGKTVGRGWFAQTQCLASLPPRVAMRGLRVFQGNIQVGDERFLVDAFAEPRFASWHIGEIHLSYDLKTNARRDDFEQSLDYEAFLEQTSLIGSHLSGLCRQSSKKRSLEAMATQKEARLAALRGISFVVDNEHRTELEELAGCLERQTGAKTGDNGNGFHATSVPLLHEVLDGRRLRNLDNKELLKTVAKRIVEVWGCTPDTLAGLETALSPFLKQ